MRIRRGELGDLPRIERIERETASMFPPSVLPPELAQPLPGDAVAAGIAASLVWIAEGDSVDAVGFILCERYAACLHVREMDVRPAFGRHGIGTQLLLHAFAAAMDLGLHFVTLTTFGHLPWNAPFHARRGFTPIRRLAPFPHLHLALRHERERGLENRVAMIRRAG